MNVLFRVFSSSASFIIDGKSFSINCENPNFNHLISLAKEQNSQELLKILEHHELQNLGLSIKEGNLYYKNLVLPHFFYYQIQKVNEKKEIMPLINTWYTLSNKISIHDQRLFGINLVSNLIPIDETSSKFVYFSIDNNFTQDNIFYKCTNANLFKIIKDNHSTVKEYIEKLWPQINTPILKELYKIIFDNQVASLDLINLGTGLAHLNQTEQLLILSNFKKNLDVNYEQLNLLCINLSKTKLIKHFNDICKHNTLARNFELLKLQNADFTIPDFTDLTELNDFFIKELDRYKNNFKLLIEKNYPELFKLNQTKITDELTLVVPEINKELIEWGQSLNHCIGGYGQRIVAGECYCIAVYKNNEVIYTLELLKNKIRQFRGQNNRAASQINYKDFTEVVNFLITNKIIPQENGVRE